MDILVERLPIPPKCSNQYGYCHTSAIEFWVGFEMDFTHRQLVNPAMLLQGIDRILDVRSKFH